MVGLTNLQYKFAWSKTKAHFELQILNWNLSTEY